MTAAESRGLRRQWFSNFEVQEADGTYKVVIPYVIEGPLVKGMETIKRAMENIQQHSRVQFIPRKSEKCYLTINNDKECYYSGVGSNSCLATISLGRGCQGYGTILHELLHALGFQHEQQRTDRNEYVKIHWDNISEGYKSQFEKLKPEDYRWNDFPFDYDSNMMYESRAFSKNSKATITKKDGKFIPRNNDLSENDIRKLRALQRIDDENIIVSEQNSNESQRAEDQNDICNCS